MGQEPKWRIRVPGIRKKIGLGDAIAGATSALGAKPCPRCKRRAQWLNERVGFEPVGRKQR